MKEVMSSLMDKQGRLIKGKTALKLRVTECEKVSAINQELKEEIQEIRKQNEVLKTTYQNYESSLKSLQAKVQDGITDRAEGGLEVVRRKIQENTKVAVIEVMKEKEDLVRDAVDKKKSFVIYGMKEKKEQNKFTRELEEREMAKTVIKRVQDSTQEVDQEVEEVLGWEDTVKGVGNQ
ncbi:hypothetical protein E2C01_084414 [Portunus trituberculatus]|uniref:Uncharacterized protein n=1 Tax=Portunus trituberculatus TaxID=210409 RepID=A0A5B7JAP1_PORTR|nr:hypothetical protein [Portunus trituberculatus]